jgi:hypothetical protein
LKLPVSHKASATVEIPPTAAPITTPIDTLSDPALVGVVIGKDEKIELVLAARKHLNRI